MSSVAGMNDSVDQIVEASGSNLAATLFLVRPEARFGMRLFYAFCRLVDDIADSETVPVEVKRSELLRWRAALREPQDGEHPIAGQLRKVLGEANADVSEAEALVDGVMMDLEPITFPDWPSLQLYCRRVASAVGLVSLRLFGVSDDSADQYAVGLGLGLQLINILRDVGEDLKNGGRIYLPENAMREVGYSREELVNRVHNPAFVRLMRGQARLARELIAQARGAIPSRWRSHLKAPRLMDRVYSAILDRMERDNFRVFERRYRVGGAQKILLLVRILAGGC